MNRKRLLVSLTFIIFFAAMSCTSASFQLLGAIQQGRMALSNRDYERALIYFERASRLDPDYRLNLSILPEGVWTYVGRAHYGLGQLPEAHKALERAAAAYEDDQLARLYLGLTLLRQGEKRGLEVLMFALLGLERWLESIQRFHPDGRYWDRGGNLRKEIERELKVIESGKINEQDLISGAEWLGDETEKEGDRVIEDWLRDESGSRESGLPFPPRERKKRGAKKPPLFNFTEISG
jgi:tetratricopeptide (TPR) repeat protein